MRDPLDDAAPVETRKAVTGIAVIVVGIALLVLARPSAWVTISIIIGLILTIMLHEAGHLIMAKRAGMKATEFFVGFGPRIWSFRKGETEYGDQGDPRRWLRPHHRHEQRRGDRPRGRAAPLPERHDRQQAQDHPRRRHGQPAASPTCSSSSSSSATASSSRARRSTGSPRRAPRPRPACGPATRSSRSTARRSRPGTSSARTSAPTPTPSSRSRWSATGELVDVTATPEDDRG